MNPFMNNINSNPTFEKRTIGDCTLYLGDSLELLAAGVFGKIGAIVSDPPYGIGYQHNGGKMSSKVTYANKTIAQSNAAAVIGDAVPFDPQPLLDAAPCVAELTKHKSRRLLIWGQTITCSACLRAARCWPGTSTWAVEVITTLPIVNGPGVGERLNARCFAGSGKV